MAHEPRWLRTLFVTLPASVLATAIATSASAQSYPSRPINVLVPYPPGGPVDVQARTIAPELTRHLGQNVLLVNRDGGGGRIAMDALRATKDGYTLSLINGPIVVIFPLLSDYKIEALKDYTPISLISDSYAILVAHPSVPFRDLKGMVAFAKANPGKLNAGNSGIGTAGHLVTEMVKYVANVDISIVNYKGASPAMTDLLSGRIHTTITLEVAKPFVDSGKLIPIATTGPERWKLFPNVPTMVESGISDSLTWSSWLGLGGPAGLPTDAVSRLNSAVVATMNSPDIRKRFEDQGYIPRSSSPDALTTYIRTETERLGKVIKAANIKLE